MDYKVDRKTWQRGGYNHKEFGDVCLLNEHGMMCCLGHCTIQDGLMPDDIMNIRILNDN